MSFIRTVAFAAAVSLTCVFALPAQAMTAASLADVKAGSVITPSAFLIGDSLLSGHPSRLDRVDLQAASAAIEGYFDFDAVFTLGAVVLGGVFVAGLGLSGARRKAAEAVAAEDRDPSWRASVFLAVQADLVEFTDGYRRAA